MAVKGTFDRAKGIDNTECSNFLLEAGAPLSACSNSCFVSDKFHFVQDIANEKSIFISNHLKEGLFSFSRF